MKNILRASGMVAALALTAISTAQAQFPGTCRTTCSSSSGSFTSVTWSTTQSRCCSFTPNPCPPGSIPLISSWTPLGGLPRLCGPQT